MNDTQKQILKQFEEVLIANHSRDFDGENFPCGANPYCEYCDNDGVDYCCTLAFFEYLKEVQDV